MNLDKIIAEASTIAISGHISPDGDCVGSSLGLYNYIMTYFPEKEVQVYLEKFPTKFLFLNGADKVLHEVPEDKVYDVYFSMDCGALDRLGFAKDAFEKAKVQCCIDHHVSNPGSGAYTYIVPTASATCELVYELTCHRDTTLEIANCLYMGMAHDTGVFQYSNVSARTLEIAGKLIELGIPASDIVENTYYEKTFVQLKVLGKCLDKAELVENGFCIFSALSLDEMEQLGATKADTDGVVSQLRYARGVDTAIFLYELEEGLYKVSLRSNVIDSSIIATHFNGGGHKKAAGFALRGSAQDNLELVLEQIRKQL